MYFNKKGILVKYIENEIEIFFDDKGRLIKYLTIRSDEDREGNMIIDTVVKMDIFYKKDIPSKIIYHESTEYNFKIETIYTRNFGRKMTIDSLTYEKQKYDKSKTTYVLNYIRKTLKINKHKFKITELTCVTYWKSDTVFTKNTSIINEYYINYGRKGIVESIEVESHIKGKEKKRFIPTSIREFDDENAIYFTDSLDIHHCLYTRSPLTECFKDGLSFYSYIYYWEAIKSKAKAPLDYFDKIDKKKLEIKRY